MAAILKKLLVAQNEHFVGTIMFATCQITPKISIFIEIGQSLHILEMAAILKKIWQFRKLFV